MNGFYKLVIAQLKANGYYFLRQGSGSHEIWTNGVRNQTVSKNMPAKPMANEIMKQAGINHRF
ncbi:type II toxin-antitoxin system HicA family toxin [Comamonas testosteroni]|uniref:type II toxin-antitoxin system HicA family toxin n=1 Tax=Comamonas testosteroni TaxID=285 RepID=UPI00265E6A4A|nr:type II toxin-antitoxin system HicA family toxin [Comamonas testosteroni]WKL15962.1 type II toxin-antitoxin system HicA family toxin [Comamonas testosteroni]